MPTSDYTGICLRERKEGKGYKTGKGRGGEERVKKGMERKEGRSLPCQ